MAAWRERVSPLLLTISGECQGGHVGILVPVKRNSGGTRVCGSLSMQAKDGGWGRTDLIGTVVRAVLLARCTWELHP